MNSFLFIVILFFSFLSASALASATLPITQTACQAVFCAKKTANVDKLSIFCDNMTEIADNFSTEL